MLTTQTDAELAARIDSAASVGKNDWDAISELQRRDAEADAAWWASMQSTTDTPVTASTPTPTGHHAAGCECGNWSGPDSECLL